MCPRRGGARSRAPRGHDGARILKAFAAEAERCVGVYATVTAPGRVRVGDEVDVELPRTSRLGDWTRAGATGVKRALLRAALPK